MEDRAGSLQASAGCEELSPCTLHLLPCCITHNGPAEVSTFFRPKNTGLDANGIEVKEAAFRGRKLLGSTLQLPQDYCGFVLERQPEGSKNKQSAGEGGYDVWRAKSQFHDITYWNHDTTPTSADSARRCMDWLGISAAIHKTVTADEVGAKVQEQGIVPSMMPSGKRKSGANV